MKMEVGLYKIKQYGKYERMHVFIMKDECFYSISSSPPLPISRFETEECDTEIIRKIKPNEKVLGTNVILSWKDEDGDQFELRSTSLIVFKNKLNANPDVFESINDFKYLNKK